MWWVPIYQGSNCESCDNSKMGIKFTPLSEVTLKKRRKSVEQDGPIMLPCKITLDIFQNIGLSNKPSYRKDVLNLLFEHHRWHDLLSFFNPTDLVTYFHSKNQADFNNSPLTNLTTKDYYFPIPLKWNEFKPCKNDSESGLLNWINY